MDLDARRGRARRVRRWPVALMTLAGALGVGLAACGSIAPAATSSSSSSSSGSSGSPSDRSGGGASGNGSDNGGGTGTGTGGGAGGAAAPTILAFSAGAHCESHGPNFSTPGQVTLGWATKNDTGVQITSDVGENASYGPNGSVTLGFSCNPNVGKSTTHTYTLTTKGGSGPAARKTVSASAVYNP